ncbi:protein rep [Adhaeribacter radiodurans]|uniref:Protein rep n=1 Tax=Adhaeribacter radiodurans TaxID=2745197 RepID=A0A7L7LCL0_9BACT|nr:protein rep [Adhaeribacter radiodurans]QMU30580.1 protein rep [Adhaeribacter radiodurans]
METNKKPSKKPCASSKPAPNVIPTKVVKTGFKDSLKSNNQEKCKSVPSPDCSPKKVSLDKLEITSELGSEVIVFDRSCEYNREKLTKRARAKFFNNNIAIALANLKTSLKDKYWDTFHCSHRIIVSGTEAKSKFCKNRWCLICNRIRTAQLIQKYGLTLDSWKEKVFLTLTVKNCTAEKLKDTLDKMHKYFTEIKDSERKAGRNLIGIRKLEITYNRTENTYHPHFHFVLESGLSAESIIEK